MELGMDVMPSKATILLQF